MMLLRHTNQALPTRGEPGPHIRLVMIVKNEAHCIRKCLDSVMPYVSSWCICDTGSTDGTIEAVESSQDKPGAVFRDEWVDFSHNRNLAFEHARSMGPCDHFFVIDADEYLEGDLSGVAYAKAYALPLDHCGRTVTRPCVLRSDVPWHYVGKIHEELHPITEIPPSGLTCATIRSTNEGGRHQVPGWHQNDIALAEADLEASVDPRILFHLAQMYECGGRLDDALHAFKRRVALGGSPGEVWWSMIRIADIMGADGRGYSPEVVGMYAKATEYAPDRIEPLVMMADYLASYGVKEAANLIYSKTMNVKMPCIGWFIVPNCYGRAPVE